MPDDVIEDTTDADRDYESEARAVGWKPEADFKGKPGRWKDAESFIHAREEQMPILQSLIAAKDKDFETRIARTERAAQAAIDASRKQSQATIDELNNQVRWYASKGDLANFDAANAKLNEARAAAASVPAEGDTDIDAMFRADNPWYGGDGDEELTNAAVAFSRSRRIDHPQEANEVNLRETARMVKRMFPDKFKPAAQRQSAVDGGSSVPSAGARRSGGYSSLPSEAKAAADKFVRQGLFKTGDEYAKVYFSEMSKERHA